MLDLIKAEFFSEYLEELPINFLRLPDNSI